MKIATAAAFMAAALAVASPAAAGLIEDMVDVMNGRPLPADREARARRTIAVVDCKNRTPFAERYKCDTLTPDQIEQYVQERRQESSAVREQNEEYLKKLYLGCLLSHGVASHECDYLTPSKPAPESAPSR